MKNIKEYLKSEDKEIVLYHKNGEMRIEYLEDSDGFWWECTYDDNGNKLTYKDSSSYWEEHTYNDNDNGNELTYKNSSGDWWESTYDNNGNELTYKNSLGVERGFDIEEMTIEQVCKALGKTIKITK